MTNDDFPELTGRYVRIRGRGPEPIADPPDERGIAQHVADAMMREASAELANAAWLREVQPNNATTIYTASAQMCALCRCVLGSGNTVRGVTFALCREVRDGQQCGRYRSTVAADRLVYTRPLAVTFDRPVRGTADPEVQAEYDRYDRLLK